MAIIIFPTVKKDGTGDISFMVGVAKYLAGKVYEPIIIVSEYKEEITTSYSLGIQIKVLDIEEFEELSKKCIQIVPSLIIEGPTYIRTRRMQAHCSVPILYLREYSTNEELAKTDQVTLLSSAKTHEIHALNLNSGFNKPRNTLLIATKMFREKRKITVDYNEYGIFILDELVKIYDKSQQREHKTDLWHALDSTIRDRLTSESYIDYFSQQKLYFQYSHNEESINHFIKLILELPEPQQKNCDVLLVGKNNGASVLTNNIDTLKNAGFTKIVLVDLKGKQSTLFEEDLKTGPTFRMLQLERLQHEDFTRIMALSEQIVGTTGDQSFSEAISLGKIPIYECRKHKSSFYRGLLNLCQEHKWLDLAHYLQKTVIYVDGNYNKPLNTADYEINFEEVYAQFLLLRSLIISDYDYLAKVKSTVDELLVSTPRQSAAKTLLVNDINSRIEKLTPSVASGNQALREVEILCNIRSLISSGLSISNALLTLNDEFVTATSDTFFKPKSLIPKFITPYLEKEQEEVLAISVCKGSESRQLAYFNSQRY